MFVEHTEKDASCHRHVVHWCRYMARTLNMLKISSTSSVPLADALEMQAQTLLTLASQ